MTKKVITLLGNREKREMTSRHFFPTFSPDYIYECNLAVKILYAYMNRATYVTSLTQNCGGQMTVLCPTPISFTAGYSTLRTIALMKSPQRGLYCHKCCGLSDFTVVLYSSGSASVIAVFTALHGM